jgi:UBX domain-containing protein 1
MMTMMMMTNVRIDMWVVLVRREEEGKDVVLIHCYSCNGGNVTILDTNPPFSLLHHPTHTHFLSGLAVQPNRRNYDDEEDSDHVEAVFGRAEASNASSSNPDDASSLPRHTIIMYRDGFVVNDGPYRRLGDPANAEFLRALANGRCPAELGGEGTTVGLIDKRHEDYQPNSSNNNNSNTNFTSFSGAGHSLRSSTTSTSSSCTDQSGLLDPEAFRNVLDSTSSPVAVDTSLPTLSVQVRLANGQRRVVTLNSNATIQDLSLHIMWLAYAPVNNSQNTEITTVPFVLTSGFPPKPLTEWTQTLDSAGLKGAQITQKPMSSS